MNWAKELDAVITVCDTDGIITEMNDKSIRHFSKYGGADLIGSNLLDCHPEPSRSRLKEMMKSLESNTYIIEDQGMKKLITQKPWFEQSKYCGFIEIQIEM
ncbi:MAG: PAS domain-containing protein [Anaerolineaceae bacterium]|nr:PAS domain-containing protein [Anaerolineaceae bacterium]